MLTYISAILMLVPTVLLYDILIFSYHRQRNFHAVHTLEAESGDLAQIIRAFFEDVHTRRAEVLVDFQRCDRRDFERPQRLIRLRRTRLSA